MMNRWLAALSAALCLHGLLLLMPVTGFRPAVRETALGKNIRIELTAVPLQEEQPRMAQKAAPSLPKKKSTEEKNIPQIEQLEKKVVVEELQILRPANRKKVRIHPVTAGLPDKRQSNSRPVAAGTAPSPAPLTDNNQLAVVASEARPLYRQNRKPVYPRLARQRGWQGTVILTVTVSRTGLAREVVLFQSSGYSLLDRAALSAVKKWRFIPALANGQPVPVTIQIPVHFELK